MRESRRITLDGSEAVASVAHRLNEVIALHPITPASPMGEWCDEWTAHGRRSMSLLRCSDPKAYERANYMRVLQSWQVNSH